MNKPGSNQTLFIVRGPRLPWRAQALTPEDLQPALAEMKRKLMERNVAEKIAQNICDSIARCGGLGPRCHAVPGAALHGVTRMGLTGPMGRSVAENVQLHCQAGASCCTVGRRLMGRGVVEKVRLHCQVHQAARGPWGVVWRRKCDCIARCSKLNGAPGVRCGGESATASPGAAGWGLLLRGGEQAHGARCGGELHRQVQQAGASCCTAQAAAAAGCRPACTRAVANACVTAPPHTSMHTHTSPVTHARTHARMQHTRAHTHTHTHTHTYTHTRAPAGRWRARSWPASRASASLCGRPLRTRSQAS